MVFIASCFKDEEYTTRFIFRSTQQVESGGDYENFSGVVVYAFKADTAAYYVANYEEALAGIIRSDATDEALTPTAVSSELANSMEGYEYAVTLEVDYEDVMLVAVDTVNEDYAYRNYTLGMNLPTTYITLTFMPWYAGTALKNNWYYVVPEATTTDTEI